MLENAIKKLKTEMEQNKNNSYIQVVGGYLLQHINTNPQDAEKILVADKTIAKSLEAMRTEASKKKVGSCAVLTDQEGFAVVLRYFDIKGTAAVVTATPVPAPATAPQSTGSSFDIRLEDLL